MPAMPGAGALIAAVRSSEPGSLPSATTCPFRTTAA